VDIRRAPAPTGDRELHGLGLLVAVVVGGGVDLWAAGQVCIRLARGAWPAFPLSLHAIVVLWEGVFRHPDDPARAWPTALRPFFPAAAAYYAVVGALALIVVLLLAASLAVVKGWRPAALLWLPSPARAGGQRASRWGRRSDLGRLLVRRHPRGRLVLGRHGMALVAVPENHSAAILGPTQTGKTTAIAVPAVMEAPGLVIAFSVKVDLLADSIEARRRLGRVVVLDPTSCTGLERDSFTPLVQCITWEGAVRVGSELANSRSARRGPSGAMGETFWVGAVAELLPPLLLGAATSGRAMADIVRWVRTQDVSEAEQAVQVAQVPEALDAMTALARWDARTRANAFTTAQTLLTAYADPAVAQASRRCDVDLRRLACGTNTVYVCAPADDQERLQPLFEAVLRFVVRGVTELYMEGKAPLNPPVRLVLDEAANIAPIRDLDRLASTAVGMGMQLVTVWQDFAQLAATYGDRAATVINNHRAKVFLGGGISDPGTLDYVARLAGQEEVTQTSATRAASGDLSTTRSPTHRSLAPSELVRTLRAGRAILIYGDLQPTRLRLRPWNHDRRLRRWLRRLPEPAA
jgi:type IV secretion system protein VirD4